MTTTMKIALGAVRKGDIIDGRTVTNVRSMGDVRIIFFADGSSSMHTRFDTVEIANKKPPTCSQCNDTGLVEASDGCPPGRCGMCNDVDDGSIDRSLLLAWTMAAMFLALTWWLLWMAWR